MKPRDKRLCNRAAKYFFRILNPRPSVTIPKKIMDHVNECPHCIENLAQFQSSQSDSAIYKETEHSSLRKIAEQMERHLLLLGAEVGCQRVKAFLPLLADPELEIRIPTPITVHVDECEQCTADYSALRSLNLGSEQLALLAEFYSQASFQNSHECAVFRDSIELAAEMWFDDVKADVLRHICLCKDCRGLVYGKRLAMKRKAGKKEEADKFPCDSITEADLFVYVLPFGLDPAYDQYLRFRASVTVHLRKCPRCLEKVRQLHNKLYSIADRSESGVVTCYETTPVVSDVDEPNAPVDCEVVKKFLPVLADNEQELMMMTPITRHIGECSQCRGDLKMLHSLRLSSEQLMKLRRTFSAKRGEGEVICSEAQEAIPSFVRMFFTKVSMEVSTHLCTCPDCRRLVYEHREELIAKLMPASMSVRDFSCRYGKRFDIFDYCFAFGAEAEQRFSRFDPEFISHAAVCPRCLSRIQKLHKTILDIAERERSGVLTSNPVIMPTEKEGFTDLDYIYTNWPVRVWVRSAAEVKVRAAAKAEAKYTTVTKTGRSTMKNRIVQILINGTSHETQ